MSIPPIMIQFFLSLDEQGGIKGKGVANLSGFYNTRMKSYMKLRSQEEQKRFLENYLEKGHNKFKLGDFKVSDIYNREDNFVISYDFSLEDYVSKNEDELYVNLTLDKEYMDEDISIKRKIPYEVDFKSKSNLTVILDIPNGYEATYLPENQEYNNDQFGFSFKGSQGK